MRKALIIGALVLLAGCKRVDEPASPVSGEQQQRVPQEQSFSARANDSNAFKSIAYSSESINIGAVEIIKDVATGCEMIITSQGAIIARNEEDEQGRLRQRGCTKDHVQENAQQGGKE